jgi:hypothetical protein
MNNPERAIVRVSACGIFAKPTFKSEMVSQALLWEEVLISDKKNNWYKIQLKYDGYQGWIHEMYLNHDKETVNMLYSEPVQKVYKQVSGSCPSKGPILSPSCRIPLDGEGNVRFYGLNPEIDTIHAPPRSFPVFFGGFDEKAFKPYSESDYNGLFADADDADSLDHLFPPLMNVSNILGLCYNKRFLIYTYAAFLTDHPYLWGGRSYQGYDCSGLIQTCANLAGYNLPRDAKDQVDSSLLYEVSNDEIEPGDLIYFKEKNSVSHVGVVHPRIYLSEKVRNRYLLTHSSSWTGYVSTIEIKIHNNDAIPVYSYESSVKVYHSDIAISDLKPMKLYKIMRFKDDA